MVLANSPSSEANTSKPRAFHCLADFFHWYVSLSPKQDTPFECIQTYLDWELLTLEAWIITIEKGIFN